MSPGYRADVDLSTRRAQTLCMRCRHIPLVLLAALVAASCSSAGALSRSARNGPLAPAVRGSIVLSNTLVIYRRDARGALRQLTQGTDDLYPVWSRAGTRIAFERGHPPDSSCPLMVMNGDGGDLHQVGQMTTDCSGASWGPSDRQLVFGAGRPFAKGPSLRVVNADGTGLRTLLRGRLSNTQAGTHPSWSPDGRTIVFGWEADPVGGLVEIRPDGSHRRVLVKPRPRQGDVLGWPTWSHDGKRLAYLREANIPRLRTIMVATASGLRRHALTNMSLRLPPGAGGWGGPTWSPNGSLIAFSGPGCGQHQGCVWTVSSHGGARRVLMLGAWVQPSWGAPAS
jgi:Tol biopolymer transport system component